MGEVELLFDALELDRISVSCPTCRTEIVFSAATSTMNGVPGWCPTCKTQLPQGVAVLDLYRRFYQALKETQLTIRLRARPPKAQSG